jgi:hypothetical protein
VLPAGIVAKESPRRLARASEAQDSPINKALLWEALGLVKDPQLYKADISIVDLGLVYDIAVRGSVVKVTLAMPHRGVRSELISPTVPMWCILLFQKQ